jgi:hypothetical protein
MFLPIYSGLSKDLRSERVVRSLYSIVFFILHILYCIERTFPDIKRHGCIHRPKAIAFSTVFS